MNDIPIGELFGALILMLVLSGFFSIAETSMMAVNRYRLRHLVKRGHRGAILTTRLLGQPDQLLGVILLGNALLNTAVAALSAVIADRLIGDSEFAVPVAALVAAFAILVISEITPKVVGAAYPERIALPSSYVLTPLLKLLSPVIWFVSLFVKALLRALHLPSTSPHQTHVLSMDELRTVVLEGGLFLPQKHRSILLNLFELEESTVDDVMTPRNQIEAIDIGAPIQEILEQLSTSYHTRVPVYEDKLDNIIGILHVRKVLHLRHHTELTPESLRDILRPPYFVPAGTPLLTQLQHFQENHRRVGLVVDEYGELQGLVSLEDILEEIVGEFTTQSPMQGALFHRDPDGSWLVEGTSQLRNLNRKLGLKFPLDGPKTLNGLILEHFEDIPEAGTSLKIAGHTLEIVQTQDRVVKVVKVLPPPLEAA